MTNHALRLASNCARMRRYSRYDTTILDDPASKPSHFQPISPMDNVCESYYGIYSFSPCKKGACAAKVRFSHFSLSKFYTVYHLAHNSIPLIQRTFFHFFPPTVFLCAALHKTHTSKAKCLVKGLAAHQKSRRLLQCH